MWLLAGLLLLFQAPDYNAQGLKALEARNYTAAVESFSQAIQADPSDYGAHFNLALAYSMLKRDADGIAEYKKVLELKPGLYAAQLNLGILLVRDKQAAAAVAYLQPAADAKPKEFRPRYYLGEAHLAAGDLAKAQEDFQTALQLNPKSAAVELGLGRSLARQKKLDDAASHFKQAAELDPSYRDSLLELAAQYEAANRGTDAAAIYQQFPDDPAAQERLAGLLIAAKRYQEAIPQLENAVAKDPTSANRLALGQAYLFTNQVDKALPLFQQCVAAEPGNYDLHMIYGRALRDHQKLPDAATQFAAALKIQPDSRETWNELAGVLYRMEDYPRAYTAYDRAHQLGDESPGNYFLRAIILDKMKQIKPALETYRKFLELSQGKFPDQEFQARHRAALLQRELDRR